MGSDRTVRIVSLLPSATEILFAVGAGDDVVGVTFECDHPPEARSRRVVSTSALPVGLPPAEVDRLVSERMAAGEDLYHLDEGALSGLNADLVVTQDLCAVCAVDTSTVRDAMDYLACRGDVLTVDPGTLAEVFESIRTIGAAAGHRDEADLLVAELTGRLAAVRSEVEAAPRPRVLVLEWTDPPFAPGHWVPDMVESAGGSAVLGESGTRSYRIGWEDVAGAAPEVVVCAPCGYGLDESAALTAEIVDRVPAGVPVWAVDANASFARPGTRLVDGVEALAGIFHPDVFGPPDPRVACRVRP
ncbi:MAG TPA: cobalamin-binding protein [Streptosporangiales bacterium]